MLKLSLNFLPLLSCFFASCLLIGQDAIAQEASHEVVIGPDVPKPIEEEWIARQTQVFRGSIRQLDGESLILVDSAQQQRTIPSRRVESVKVSWANKEIEPAQVLLQEGKHREAYEALEKAYRSGVPRWQQRFVIANMIQAAQAMGNVRAAGILFSNLADTNPPALLYADLPLCWTVKQPPRGLADQAEKWLASEKEVEMLLGASWLLFSRQQDEASRKLKQLQGSANKPLAQLATAQSWRLVPPPKTNELLPKWLEFREKLIPPLRIGPSEFIADRLMRSSQPELAVAQWIRIANEHPDRYDRATKALQQAKEILQREGRNEEAKRLEIWIEKDD